MLKSVPENKKYFHKSMTLLGAQVDRWPHRVSTGPLPYSITVSGGEVCPSAPLPDPQNAAHGSTHAHARSSVWQGRRTECQPLGAEARHLAHYRIIGTSLRSEK